MRRVSRCIISAVLLAAAAGCGGGDGPAKSATRHEMTAQWQDVFDGTPDVYVVVRPQAIKRDPVFGPLWQTAVRLAQSRNLLNGPTALEAAEGCDEIVVGTYSGDDAAIVFRGVSSGLDPGRVADGNGRPLFRSVGERGRVAEYEPRAAGGGSLFVLPDRTWVVALGEARGRARQAYTTPFGRPAPRVDERALAVVRFGEAVVQSPRYTKSLVFGPLTRKLAWVSVALEPGKSGLLLTFQYQDEDGAAWGEMHAKRIAEALANAPPPETTPPPAARRPGGPPARRPQDPAKRLEWLKDTKVAREENAVKVSVSLPARLLEELPNANPADMPL